MRYRLSNDREVFLIRFAVSSLYSGLLEGTPEDYSRFIRKKGVDNLATSMMPPAKPLVVVPSSAMPLPEWLCVAELYSRQGVRETDPDYASSLYVCWFAEDTGSGIDAMIQAVLPHVNWEQAAEDYNIMDF